MHTPDERVYRQRGVRQTGGPEFRPLTLPRGAYEREEVSNLIPSEFEFLIYAEPFRFQGPISKSLKHTTARVRYVSIHLPDREKSPENRRVIRKRYRYTVFGWIFF